ncbi:transcriptional repressor [Qipengyuania citrea]|uniref:transcriptional repressor n=1 Tax=Qipengyuania TaxID=1855416 RepID=UPI003338A7C3
MCRPISRSVATLEQRRQMFRILLESDEHLSVEDLYKRARLRYYGISLLTV